MRTNHQKTFIGFSPESLNFLKNVRTKNSKAWFEENKHDYEICLLDPLKNLVTDLGGNMLEIDAGFEIRPSMDIFRKSIDENPARFLKVISFYKKKNNPFVIR